MRVGMHHDSKKGQLTRMVFSIGAITVAAVETVSRTGTQMGRELRKFMKALPLGVPSRLFSKKCTMLVPTLSAKSRCSCNQILL